MDDNFHEAIVAVLAAPGPLVFDEWMPMSPDPAENLRLMVMFNDLLAGE